MGQRDDLQTGSAEETLRRLGELIREVEDRGRRGSEMVRPGGGRERSRGEPRPVSRAAALDRLLPTGWSEVDRTLAGLDPRDATMWDTPGGLARGAIHEWFADWRGEFDEDDAVSADPGKNRKPSSSPRRSAEWIAPLTILIHLAWRLIDPASPDLAGGQQHDGAEGGRPAGRLVWIGRRVQPYPHHLLRRVGPPRRARLDRRLLERSIFLDPKDDADRLWAIDLALRCPAVVGVIADGSRLDMAATRRLQLAAEAGASIGLLARSAAEFAELSAASTRWVIRPEVNAPPISRGEWQAPRSQRLPSAAPHQENGDPASIRLGLPSGPAPATLTATPSPRPLPDIAVSRTPRWSVELRRGKGLRFNPDAVRRWTLGGVDSITTRSGHRHGAFASAFTFSDSTNLVVVSADLVGRSRPPAMEAGGRRSDESDLTARSA